jgi:hypothetical protein
MKTGRTAALGAALALALGAAACGESGDDSSTTTQASTTATTHTGTQMTSTADSSGSANGGLTPPGATLGFGDEATVGWVPPSRYSGTGGQQGYRLQVSVEGIEQGSIDDFKNIELDADQQKSTPYYVKVSVKALEDVNVGTDDPDITFDAIDDRGQEQGSVTFFGEFERCDDTQVPRPFPNGKSYESCLTYLVPGGGSIDEVHWRSGPSSPNEVTPYFDDPVVWSGS